MFEFGGAYGGAYGGMVGGATIGGVPGLFGGMFAGGALGFKAGDKAAETLERIAQGQATIVKKPPSDSLVQNGMQVIDGQPTSEEKQQAAEDMKVAIQAIMCLKTCNKQAEPDLETFLQ